MENTMQSYNNAKMWQIALFALNNAATNLYLFFFFFISYYATGVAGLVVVVVSTVITFMRVWDGFTDPMIGFIIDKTESKLGKFRPFMLIGNIILAVMTLIIINMTHQVPDSLRLLFFIAMYALWVIGYTFQTACTKAAQTVLTNNPKQRPFFTFFDAIYVQMVFIGGQNLVASYLMPKYGDFNMGFFNEFAVIVIGISVVLTLLAITSIWNKDVKENWGVESSKRIRFKDYLEVIKGNRPLQMLIVSASTDKLANLTKTNAVVTVIIYGILMGNYALSGTLQLLIIPFIVLMTFVGVRFAGRLGQKRAYVVATYLSIILSVILFIFMVMTDLKTISLNPINIQTIVFLALMILVGGVVSVGGNIVIPMIADTSDYETYRSGRYVPGMISTIFSFIDKLISSISASVIGFGVALIGFKDSFPTPETPYSSSLLWLAMFFFIGLPILAWVTSLLAMRYYELDNDKMKEIQEQLNAHRA